MLKIPATSTPPAPRQPATSVAAAVLQMPRSPLLPALPRTQELSLVQLGDQKMPKTGVVVQGIWLCLLRPWWAASQVSVFSRMLFFEAMIKVHLSIISRLQYSFCAGCSVLNCSVNTSQ
ncbi:MAG TPA: hypothetical protein VGJ16_02095 [Pirellulales bacterium]